VKKLSKEEIEVQKAVEADEQDAVVIARLHAEAFQKHVAEQRKCLQLNVPKPNGFDHVFQGKKYDPLPESK
jgi:hypothetical protein